MDFYPVPNTSDLPLSSSNVDPDNLTSALPLMAIFVCVLGAVYWCVQDYYFFLSLGKGGRKSA
jgi:hypothetical protein